VATIVFYLAAVASVVAAILCITRKSPIASALWLVYVMFNLSVLYVLLDAHFLAAVQVLVYAGAIMVLFLFVIMLLNIGRLGESDVKGAGGKVIALVAGLLMLAELAALRNVDIPTSMGLPDGAIARQVEQQGAVQAIAMPLFQQYLVPFEITSVMLLAALVGAVVLAKRKI
jgi:NADH-quinone oxidoreductase subunit J